MEDLIIVPDANPRDLLESIWNYVKIDVLTERRVGDLDAVFEEGYASVSVDSPPEA